MDTSKMRELKALAEAATQSHGTRRVEVDHNGVHVIGDGSWKILSAWHTPDEKGRQNAEFAAASSPATVLALLAEIDNLKQCLDMESAELAWSDSDGRAIQAERDQLKAENEKMRSFLSEVSRTSGDKWAVMAARNLLKELGDD